MAEPTLKDVMKALVALKADVAAVDAKVDAHRAETEAHRAETAKGFAALDEELAQHADTAHRDVDRKFDKLEKDVAALKGRPGTRPSRRPRTTGAR